MSSCDSVSPTTFRAGAEHSEGVTYTPHKGSRQLPGTGRPSQQLAGYRPKNRVTWKVRLSFRVAAGISFQLPRGRDVGPLSENFGRARCAAGGCRSSGWALVLLARLSLALVRGVVFCLFPFPRTPSNNRHFCRYFPLSSGTSVPCTRSPESAGQFFVNFVMGLMVGDRRFPGATILGASSSTSSANHRVSVPPTGNIADAQCTSWQFSANSLMDLSSCAS